MTSIAIDGTFNARSVGSPSAPWLVRSAALDAITDAGLTALARLKVALVVDLRESAERGVVRHRLPVFHRPVAWAPAGAPGIGALEDVYENLIYSRGAELTAAVAAIAESPDPVLVHCTAGKDRTGIVVALTLLAAGASVAEVVDDYALSSSEVRLFSRELAEAELGELPLTEEDHEEALRLQLDSPADALRQVVHTLTRFGGVEAYLLRHGLSVSHFHALRERFANGSDGF